MQVRGPYPTVYFKNQISTDHLVPVTPSVSEQLQAFPQDVSLETIISYALAIVVQFLNIRKDLDSKAIGLYWSAPNLMVGNRMPAVPQLKLFYDGNFYDKGHPASLPPDLDISAFVLAPELEADFQRYKSILRLPKHLSANRHHSDYTEEMAAYSLINLMYQIQQQISANPAGQLVIVHEQPRIRRSVILGTACIQPEFLPNGYRIL